MRSSSKLYPSLSSNVGFCYLCESQTRKMKLTKEERQKEVEVQGKGINGGGNREILLLEASHPKRSLCKRTTHFREGHLVSHPLPLCHHRRPHRLALPLYIPCHSFLLFSYPFPISCKNNLQVLIFLFSF